MVFKKPYAFLIKNFKIIHLMLSGLIILIISQYRSVSGFFSEYMKDTIQSSYGLAQKYISSYLYIAIIIVIVFSLIMILLMRKKDKPLLFYILIIAYYSVLLIAIIYASSVMASLEEGVLTQQTARTLRDMYFIIQFPQYYFVIQSLVRGIGFDVKKFNFRKDLHELEIANEDNEEFEFVLRNDTYLYERKARRVLREMKYYVLENKLIFMGVAAIIGIFLFIYIITNFNFINILYKLGKGSNIGNFYYQLNSAYITEYDYNGKLIKKGSKYIVVNLTIRNNTSQAKNIDNTILFLKYGNSKAYNQPSLRNNFIDIGESYINTPLAPNVTKDYIFIFEVSSKTKIKNCNLRLLKDITYDKDNQVVYNYSGFKFNPQDINMKPKRLESEINGLMYLGDRIFLDSNLIISKIEVLNKYEYKYESCKENVCKEYTDIISPSDIINQQLLVITYKLQINKESGINTGMFNDKFLFDKYLRLEYEYNKKDVQKELIVRTYPALKNVLFIDVAKVAVSSNKFNLMLNTREQHYYIDLKNK